MICVWLYVRLSLIYHFFTSRTYVYRCDVSPIPLASVIRYQKREKQQKTSLYSHPVGCVCSLSLSIPLLCVSPPITNTNQFQLREHPGWAENSTFYWSFRSSSIIPIWIRRWLVFLTSIFLLIFSVSIWTQRTPPTRQNGTQTPIRALGLVRRANGHQRQDHNEQRQYFRHQQQ